MDKLEALLNDLENGYNPNYVDMAVINAVKAWKSIKGASEEATATEAAPDPVPEQDASSTQEESAPAETDEEDDEPELTEEEMEDQKWTEHEVKRLKDHTDYVSLMLDHERHVGGWEAQDSVKSMREFYFTVTNTGRLTTEGGSDSFLCRRVSPGFVDPSIRVGERVSCGYIDDHGHRPQESRHFRR